jgi:hypothetical protein
MEEEGWVSCNIYSRREKWNDRSPLEPRSLAHQSLFHAVITICTAAGTRSVDCPSVVRRIMCVLSRELDSILEPSSRRRRPRQLHFASSRSHGMLHQVKWHRHSCPSSLVLNFGNALFIVRDLRFGKSSSSQHISSIFGRDHEAVCVYSSGMRCSKCFEITYGQGRYLIITPVQGHRWSTCHRRIIPHGDIIISNGHKTKSHSFESTRRSGCRQ